MGNVKENITVSTKGADIIIAFNSKYFTDCLRATEDEYIKINFIQHLDVFIITSMQITHYINHKFFSPTNIYLIAIYNNKMS